jgi:hypothetical protein
MKDPFTKLIECKISDWSCIYHACMTNHCCKKEVLKHNKKLGPGKCEKKKNNPE